MKYAADSDNYFSSQVIGAGILHGEKSPAIQAVMSSPLLSSINITHSGYDGINIISPTKTMNMLYNKIENNMGVGISAAILTGEVCVCVCVVVCL